MNRDEAAKVMSIAAIAIALVNLLFVLLAG
jgi:hypothetical protein